MVIQKKNMYVHSLLYKLYYKFYSYDLTQSKYYIQQAIFSLKILDVIIVS